MLTLTQVLMVAVLEQAVADLGSLSFNVRRQARAWFLARGARANHIFAFSHICQEFGRDPATARVRLLAKFDGNPNGGRLPQDRPSRTVSSGGGNGNTALDEDI
jgi:hypothetical protein